MNGWARPEFRGVVRVFSLAFTRYRVGGGAICVYVDGEPVLDLWAGVAQKGQEWTRDTAPVIFSASKGVTATIIHRLVDRGLLDYRAPVAQYWPGCRQRQGKRSRSMGFSRTPRVCRGLPALRTTTRRCSIRI